MQSMPVLLLLASMLRAATAASNTSCATEYSCGDLAVRYPFSLAGAQPLYCGYPVFDLACDASAGRGHAQAYLRRTFRERLFRVADISYANNSMVAAFAGGDTSGCPVPDFNVSSSLALFPFIISGTNRRLVFFHGCEVPPKLRLPWPCGNRTMGAYISGRWDEGDDRLLPGVSRSCMSVSVPVRGGTDQPARRHDYERLIAEGFLLDLPPPLGDCDACRRARGECRLIDVLSFQCVCPDGKLCSTAARPEKGNFKLKIGAGNDSL